MGEPKMDEIFNNIYKNNTWGYHGDGSGSGSDVQNTTATINVLLTIIEHYDITQIVDVSCGSCVWMANLLHALHDKQVCMSYRGFDVSSIAIERARKNLDTLIEHHDIELTNDNFTTCKFSNCRSGEHKTLVLCRDTFQHLSFNAIKKGIDNIRHWFPSALYVFGGYKDSYCNVNIQDGDYFSINYSLSPFNLTPDIVYEEARVPHEPVKYFFVFTSLQTHEAP